MSTFDCAYCGVRSIIGGSGDSPDAPRLRIDPPPPIDSGTGGLVFVTVMFGAISVALIVLAFTVTTGLDRIWPGAIALLFGVLTAFFFYGVLGFKRTARELMWFRDNGLPGRATVRRISAGAENTATLGLELELTGKPAWQLDHWTAIPPLLIPRLTEGLTLPVIVHPEDRDRIEVQWHLV